jgi:hypothetical protein
MEPSRSPSLPTDTDLDELSTRLRDAARKRDLSDQITTRYEKWSFLFLGWCLQVPPYQIHRDRIGDFWHALNHREVNRGEICLAMDALGFFFSSLSDDAPLSFSSPTPPRGDEEPSDTTAAELCAPLPDGPLPESIDVPSVVPTQPAPSTDAAPSDPEPPEAAPDRDDPPSFWTLLQSEEEKTNPFEESEGGSASDSDDDTVSVDLPQPVADRVQAMARRRNLSVDELITELLDSASEDEDEDEESPRPLASAHA